MKPLSIGILREGKTPPDTRTPLIPKQCLELKEQFPNLTIKAMSSDFRCYSNYEYEKFGVPIVDDVSDCDILLGIKEVPISQLIDGKTYFFFSHTIKQQSHNRNLLKAVIEKKISLIDWETITDDNHIRLQQSC